MKRTDSTIRMLFSMQELQPCRGQPAGCEAQPQRHPASMRPLANPA
ncbi:hypothetical protein JR065_09490 [Xanthomonas sp. AmX2]|nr:hypothetical protein [Xanthomonas sp.]MBN6150574.1 hypothetical protein [Xanthomonas sp.]